jgi:uncharacterized protein (TIGR01440 family)
MKQYSEALAQALTEFMPLSGLKLKQILVIGCSTSEVLGNAIGKGYSQELGREFFQVVSRFCSEYGVFAAFQCCEHLNRALVIEQAAVEKYGLTEVAVVPVPGAGGSMAAAAFAGLQAATVVENLHAHAGIDIGDTFIGMHLRPVAVPVRTSISELGKAHVTYARTRPKLIGGQRAIYTSATCS